MRRARWADRAWQGRDVLCAVALGAGATYELLVAPFSPAGYVGNSPVSIAASTAVVAACVIRRRSPLGFAAVVTMSTTLLWWQGRGQGELPFIAFSSYLLAAYGLGAHLARSEALAAGALTLALWGIPDVIDAREGLPSVHQDAGFYVLCGLALAAGVGAAALRAQSAALRAALVEVERGRAERERLATADERRRIARDMHDVLTHSMSAVAVLAGAARLRSPDPEGTLQSIELAAREAMAELRRMLGALHSDDSTASSEPSPTLDDLPALLAPLQHSGVEARLVVTGEARAIAPGTALSAYRVVQESLTNVLRHAPASTEVTVEVGYADAVVTVEVRDDGGSTSASAAEAGSGHGLRGMRERVTLYGGSVEAGPAGCGWVVRATLPAPP